MAPELVIMLDALAEQHKLFIPSDVFPFNWYKGQQHFDSLGASTEYGVDPPYGCIPLIERLAKLGVIKMKTTTPDNLESYSEYAGLDNPEKWGEYIIPIDGRRLICEVLMNNKDVQKAKHSLARQYEAELLFADNEYDDYCMPFVRILGDKDYSFRRLRIDGHPYKVFSYAVEQKKNNRNEPIYIDELIKQKKMRKDQNYVSNIFKDLPAISEALSPFIDIQTNSIYVKNFKTVITEAQKELIQKHAK